MALTFPETPSLNERFIYNDKVYTWTGTKWATGPIGNKLISGEYRNIYYETQETFVTLDTYRYNFFDITTSNTSANLLKQTQVLSNNTSWTRYGGSIVDNTNYDPVYGQLTADSFIETNGHTTEKYMIQTASFTSGTRYTTSVYAKAIGSRHLALIFPDTAYGVFYIAYFNLSAGTYTMNTNATSGGAVATITPLLGGWYRCTFSATATTTASGNLQLRLLNNSTNTNNYTGDGVSGVCLWGAQFEIGSTASKYKRITTYPYYNLILSNSSVYDKILVKLNVGGTNTIEWNTIPYNIIWSEGVAPTIIQSKIIMIEFQKFKDQWYGYVLTKNVNI